MVSLIYLPVLISLFFLIISNFPILISGTTCYSPDGSAVNDALYQPCINIQGVESMCCALNATSTPDICSPNGLCVAGWGNQAYWRDFCTDSTWKSPNCLPKTTCDEAAGGSSNGSTTLRLCDDGKWCCGESNESCCNAHAGFSLAPTLVAIGASATSNTRVTVTANNGSSIPDVAVGVGVGVPLGILAIAMLGVGFWWGGRRARLMAVRTGVGRETEGLMQSGKGDENEVMMLPVEQNAIYEASAGLVRPVELPERTNVEENRNRGEY